VFGVFALSLLGISALGLTFLSVFAYAQSAKEILNSPDWTKATIITDGGSVYSRPDFDSSVSDYLNYGTKVWILKKPQTGTGGMGIFYKTRYKSKSGYLTDTDVRITGKSAGKKGKKSASSDDDEEKKIMDPTQIDSKAWARNEEDEREGPQTLYFTRDVGGALALIHFTEKFSGKRLSSQVPMLGLRMTGPGVLFDGPPLDVNILFTPTEPGYYTRVTDKSVKGFMFFGDVMAVLPLFDGDKTIVYYGLGIMWTYTNYKVQVKNSTFDSQEFRIGGEAGLGVGLRVTKKLTWRADAKYYIEKTQYYGLLTSLQTEF
jgi:hypothetical protein